MKKQNELIGKYQSKSKIVDLGEIHPLGKAVINTKKVGSIMLSPDNKIWIPSEFKSNDNVDFAGETARYIKMEDDFEIELYTGNGYYGVRDEEWTKLFSRNELWTGGDGFFTFNLKGGKENYGLKDEEVRTMCVFGDTLTGTLHPVTKNRIEPLLMPNSSIAIIDGNKPLEEKTKFIINKNNKGHLISFFEPEVDLAFQGFMASNLTRSGYDSSPNPWLTSYNPEEVAVIFTFNKSYLIDYIDIYNYFYKSKFVCEQENRGLKFVDVYYSNDNKNFTLLKRAQLEKADASKDGQNYTRINIEVNAKYLKLVGDSHANIGNWGGINGKEHLFGLSKVLFYSEGRYLMDVKSEATSELSRDSKRAWYWLQDGVYINNNVHFFPLIIKQDLSQPEGFQFAVEGVASLTLPIISDEPHFEKLTQKDTNLHIRKNGEEWYFGAGFFSNTKDAGAINPDGYIYIYGYTQDKDAFANGRVLRVARCLPEDINNYDEWRYFDGNNWSKNMVDAKAVLKHVSCEMSVSYDNGQYIAVYSYNVRSPYLTYSTAPTPYGPFTEPRICYVAPEVGKGLYHYNGKAHPHLTQSGGLLATYNVNTQSMEENEERGEIYAPRFVRLNKN